jgi:hypothetical protein
VELVKSLNQAVPNVPNAMRVKQEHHANNATQVNIEVQQ